MKKIQLNVKVSGHVIDEHETTNLVEKTRKNIDVDIKINICDDKVNINIDNLNIQEYFNGVDKNTFKTILDKRTKKISDVEVPCDTINMIIANLLK